MFGIGASELVLIVIIALIVVGPKNLPVTLRAIGRAIAEFRRASRELRREVGYDEVVDEVTRPLREGMAGIEAEVQGMKKEVREAGQLTPISKEAALGKPVAKKEPGTVAAGVWSNEYPEGGADDAGALPEDANPYPEVAPTYSSAKADALESVSQPSAGRQSNES